MNKQTFRYKAVYLTFIGALCAGLVAIAYFAFLQTVDIDMMLGMHLAYSGPSGHATVTATGKTDDINQRIRGFMETATYTVEPNQNLSNGDIITIKAHWDSQYASDFHFRPVNTSEERLVEGLPQAYETVVEIPREYLEKSEEEARKYLQGYLKGPVEGEPVYGAFLNAPSANRLLWLYEIDKEGQEPVWYMVLIPEITDSQNIAASRIYAERAYLNDKEQEDRNFAGYVEKLYAGEYDIEEILTKDPVLEEGTEDQKPDEENAKEAD